MDLEREIDQKDLEECDSWVNNMVNNSDEVLSIRRIDPIDTAY